MLRTGATLLFIAISIIQCGSYDRKEPNMINEIEKPDSQSSSPIIRCGLEGFTQAAAEHIINEIKQPCIVKNIRGKILNATGHGWTKNVRVLFEIRRTEGGNIIKTYADDKGNFKMKDIPEGQYFFKATVLGWQSVMGVIIVNKSANPNSQIVFKMLLGV
jgi:hypothetical protein